MPHSEIHGSKLILSSSWLIAEYHVFHRLLLPRHSPNALLALDLIQKKQDFACAHAQLVTKGALYSEPKAYFPAPIMSVIGTWFKSVQNLNLVSVLDLDNSVRFSWQTLVGPRKQS